jgi:hypothetical protein
MAPKLSDRVELVAAGDQLGNVTKQPRRGMRSKVCVTDWNGDGRLDLLVGDYTVQKPDQPEPTAAENAEHDKIRTELNTVRQDYSKLSQKMFSKSRPKDAADLKQLQVELKKSRDLLLELQSKLPSESEDHGWVWYFQRLPE